MKKGLFGLVDYDMGNLRSVAKALEVVGARVAPVTGPRGFAGLDALVLPGVGAFGAAVRNLRRRRLMGPIRDWILSGKPFLGICLGYQLLFQKGEESRSAERGLGIFSGKVRKFPARRKLKIPHMGWNQVRFAASRKSAGGIFSGIPQDSFFYFVHSYYPEPRDGSLAASVTRYGVDFVSSVRKDRLFACQFHPEKSGKDGLRILSNFAGIALSRPC